MLLVSNKQTLYDQPEYYEVAFSFRDIVIEVSFLQSCIERFATIPVHRILSIGCGTSSHLEEITKKGYQYVGLDINEKMLEYSRLKSAGISPKPEFHQGDMVSFQIPQKCDTAFVMLGSLCVRSNKELDSHFDSMARALTPGGLYLLDCCIQFSDPLARQSQVWRTRKDGISVVSRFDLDYIDPVNQLYHEIWTVTVNDHGVPKYFQTVQTNRAIYPQEFLLYINARKDFEFLGWWNNWDLSRPLDGSTEVLRPVTLLRRINSSTE